MSRGPVPAHSTTSYCSRLSSFAYAAAARVAVRYEPSCVLPLCALYVFMLCSLYTPVYPVAFRADIWRRSPCASVGLWVCCVCFLTVAALPAFLAFRFRRALGFSGGSSAGWYWVSCRLRAGPAIHCRATCRVPILLLQRGQLPKPTIASMHGPHRRAVDVSVPQQGVGHVTRPSSKHTAHSLIICVSVLLCVRRAGY